MVYPHESQSHISLRWHYPNQVPGQSIQLTLSLLHTQAPLCTICYHAQVKNAMTLIVAKFAQKTGRKTSCSHALKIVV